MSFPGKVKGREGRKENQFRLRFLFLQFSVIEK